MRLAGTAGQVNLAARLYGLRAGSIGRHDRLITKLDPVLPAVNLVLENPSSATILDPQTKSRQFGIPRGIVVLIFVFRAGLDLRNIALVQFQFNFSPPFSGLPEVDLGVYLGPFQTTIIVG